MIRHHGTLRRLNHSQHLAYDGWTYVDAVEVVERACDTYKHITLDRVYRHPQGYVVALLLVQWNGLRGLSRLVNYWPYGNKRRTLPFMEMELGYVPKSASDEWNMTCQMIDVARAAITESDLVDMSPFFKAQMYLFDGVIIGSDQPEGGIGGSGVGITSRRADGKVIVNDGAVTFFTYQQIRSSIIQQATLDVPQQLAMF